MRRWRRRRRSRPSSRGFAGFGKVRSASQAKTILPMIVGATLSAPYLHAKTFCEHSDCLLARSGYSPVVGELIGLRRTYWQDSGGRSEAKCSCPLAEFSLRRREASAGAVGIGWQYQSVGDSDQCGKKRSARSLTNYCNVATHSLGDEVKSYATYRSALRESPAQEGDAPG